MLFSPKPINISQAAYASKTADLLKQKRMALKPEYPMINTFPHGSPLGGFGAGTFSRTVQGDFAVWHLFSGIHIYEPLKGCNLAVYQKIGNKKYAYALNHNPQAVPSAWKPLPLNGSKYAALYPKSWYVYDALPAQVVVEQFSPVLPYNYRETSFPAGCFRVQIKNTKSEAVEVSVLLSWENLIGWSSATSSGEVYPADFHFKKNNGERHNKRIENYEYKGIVLGGEVSEHKKDCLTGEFCIATKEVEGTKVYFCTTYDGAGDGSEVWETFADNGTLKDSLRFDLNAPNAAIAVKATLNPGETVEIPLVIAWDIPYANNKKFRKYYTKYFDASGQNSFVMAKEILENMPVYAEKIDYWHQEYTVKKNLPGWLTNSMFNELYWLADGGSIWDADTERFTYLECFDYYFYDTVDVRFYGSFALAKFWPEIEKKAVLELSRTVFDENRAVVDYHKALSNSGDMPAGQKQSQFIQRDIRKRKFSVPHDLGSPFEEVWTKLNAYTWQNANRWKDLNSKFVLMVYRAYYYSGKKDQQFLKDCWPALLEAVNYVDTDLDNDNDHLPENEAFPDQTFDNWVMRGTSAYCGIIRLASLQTAIQIAYLLDEKTEAQRLRDIYKTAKDSLHAKLWNGNYYNYDQKSDDVMAAQLMGQWYLDQLHLPGVLPEQNIQRTLGTILKYNYEKFCQGKKGVVNGRTIQGLPVSCSQGNDVWTGINYALAAHLIMHGQQKEAMQILKTVTDIVKNRGFLFRTPESWDAEDKFIGSMYMRPGSIWALADLF